MTHRPEHHPIRSRIDQRAKELLADTQGMVHRASNLAAPDLPRRVEDCPQADVGLCCPQEHKSEPRPPTQSCQGLAGRSTRLAVFGQPEDQLWRGTRPAVGLEGLAFFEEWVRGNEDISSAIQRPDNVAEAIWADFLQELGNVRKRIAGNAKQILQRTDKSGDTFYKAAHEVISFYKLQGHTVRFIRCDAGSSENDFTAWATAFVTSLLLQ